MWAQKVNNMWHICGYHGNVMSRTWMCGYHGNDTGKTWLCGYHGDVLQRPHVQLTRDDPLEDVDEQLHWQGGDVHSLEYTRWYRYRRFTSLEASNNTTGWPVVWCMKYALCKKKHLSHKLFPPKWCDVLY